MTTKDLIRKLNALDLDGPEALAEVDTLVVKYLSRHPHGQRPRRACLRQTSTACEGVSGMIEMTKKYRYASGEPARILCVDRPGPSYPVLSMADNGTLYAHDADGKYAYNYRDRQLIEVSPWGDFELDQPVMVSDAGEGWSRRYFAGVKDGKPLAWTGGKTSWTASGLFEAWSYCRLPTEEELK